MQDERLWYTLFNSYYSRKTKEIFNKQINKPFNPVYAGFKITEKCNQHCRHCWAGKSTKEYDFSDIAKALDRLKEFDVYHLTLTGGEPFCRVDCIDIVRYAKKNFPVVEVFTNAFLLNEDLIEELSTVLGKNDFIQVSLDGLEDSYKQQRGIDGYNNVVDNIKKLISAGVNIRINMTATQYNEFDIFNVYKKSIELGCKTFSLSFVVSLRKGVAVRNETSFTEYERAINLIRLHHNEKKINMNLRIFTPLEIKSRYAESINQEDLIYFNDNVLHWTIDAEGNIYNFIDHYKFKELKIGNIYSDNVSKINDKNLDIQRKILYKKFTNTKCANCSLLKSCQGGNYIDNYPNMNYPGKGCVANV